MALVPAEASAQQMQTEGDAAVWTIPAERMKSGRDPALADVNNDRTEAAYRRTDLFERRRTLHAAVGRLPGVPQASPRASFTITPQASRPPPAQPAISPSGQ